MAQKVALTIDGKPVAVPPGTTVFDAARQVGIEIPHLCYAPECGLAPTGACRLCVVEVEGAKSLVASCVHPVAEGMVVRTDTEKLRDVRRMILDLLLSNHPHDCLTCEKNGDCDLQKYAYELGVKEPEFAGEPVTVQPTRDGPAIVYDPSKCILCARCVQVCHEIQVTGAIDLQGRGFDTRVALPPGLPRDQSVCSECGNCVDVCPTGALSNAAAEGRGRAWEFKRVRTICPYCGCGCTLTMNIRDNHVVKITGEPGVGVSGGWLCVKGRFGMDFVGHSDRLTTPLIRRDGELRPATWDEALDYAARRLRDVRDKHGPDAVGGLSSATTWTTARGSATPRPSPASRAPSAAAR